MREFRLQALFALFGRIRGARRRKPTVKFLLDQCGVFQQSNDFGPDDLIEQILADKAAVVANRTTQFSPAIGTNTFVVVDFACTRLRGCTREGVAALLTADQPLHDTWRDGSTARSYFVLLKEFLGTGEALFAYQCRHGDLDPFFARALVAGCGAGRNHTAPTQRTDDARPCRGAGLAETGDTTIRRVTQHSPDRRAFPAGTCFASRNAFGVDPASDLADAESFNRVHLIDALNHTGLGLQHGVRGGDLVGLADITVSIRSAAHNADFTRVGPVSLTTARSLQNLSPFVLRDHSLELHQQLIFRAGSLRRFDKQRFNPIAG